MFEREFLDKWDIVSYQCKEQFYSKKNNVALFSFVDSRNESRDWVVKVYTSSGKQRKETEILTCLQGAGLAVPQIIYAADRYAVLEYIRGQTLLHWFEESEKTASALSDVRLVVEALADWLIPFYDILLHDYGRNMILGDVNYRNFILADGFYGLDFEDCRTGLMEEDIGRLCAFALTYDPAFTLWKYQFVTVIRDIIAVRLELSWESVFIEIQNELLRMTNRRKTNKIRPDLLNNIKHL